MTVTSDVRYVPKGDNRVLRHVLRSAWGGQCYWCGDLKAYTELEIDHIVPQAASPEVLKGLKKDFGLSDDYDIHAVTNLAPICGKCNTDKTSEDFTYALAFLTKLKKARKLATKVSKGVASFTKSQKVGAALLLASEADLENDDERETFLEGAPAVVQKLAETGETVDIYTSREVSVSVQDQDVAVGLRLNEEGRSAARIIEDVVGADMSEALVAALEELFDKVEGSVAGSFEIHDEGMGAPSVGGVTIEFPSVVLRKITYTAGPPVELYFELEGDFEGTATASVARSDLYEGDLEEVQGDASFACTFTIFASWDSSDAPGELNLTQVWLDEVDVDTAFDGRSSMWWNKM